MCRQVKYAKGDREAEMRTVVNYMAEKLESELKGKLSKLKGQKNSICNETEFLEKILEEVEKEVNVSFSAISFDYEENNDDYLSKLSISLMMCEIRCV